MKINGAWIIVWKLESSVLVGTFFVTFIHASDSNGSQKLEKHFGDFGDLGHDLEPNDAQLWSHEDRG